MKQIPNLFTLLNLVAGCLAVIFILQTNQTIVYINNEGFTEVTLPENIVLGAFFIMGAGVIDFLDGFVARIMKSESSMGKQLDSLSDMVSFGVAPGMIIYQLLRISFAGQENGLDISIAWLLPAILIPCAAAWRLAKFNEDTEQQFSFKGLPTPAAGIFIASFPVIMWFQTLGLQALFINKILLYTVIFLISVLMVSNLPLMSMKFRDFSFKNNVAKYLLALIAVLSAVFMHWAAIPVVLLAYILVSLLLQNKTT